MSSVLLASYRGGSEQARFACSILGGATQRDLGISPFYPALPSFSPQPLHKGKSSLSPRALLRRAAAIAGLSACHFTPHSLRRGGASFSYAAGVPLDHIKLHGTWTSHAVNSYLISTSHFNTPVSVSFAHILHS